MKTFKDLKFEPHSAGSGIHAIIKFENGYGVSVVQGPFFYTEGINEYEIAVLNEGTITYDTPITDDVLGHQSEDEVSDVMKRVQEL